MKKAALSAMVLFFAFSTEATASDWNFYGSSRIGLWSVEQSMDWPGNPLTNKSYRSTLFEQQTNSRIGARIENGHVTGRFEYGATSTGNARLRLLYGDWHVGNARLRVDQDYTPTYFTYSNQVANADNGLEGYGNPSLRVGQVTFKYGPFEVAAIEPSSKYPTNATYSIVQTVLPKLEAAYEEKFGPFLLHVSGGYNSVNLVDGASNRSISTHSYVAGVMGAYTSGALTAGVSFTFGRNGDEYNDSRFSGTDASGTISGSDYLDNDDWGASGVIYYKINDRVAAEAGYGYVRSTREDLAEDDAGQSYYFQLPITLADGVIIVPEFTMFDFMNDAAGASEGTVTWLGAKVQINF